MAKVIESRFYNAQEISEILQVSTSYAYRLIRDLNTELANQGKITIRGKISRRYFNEKVYM
jgi:DNA-directed RNA polymerase specialized sigma subunit